MFCDNCSICRCILDAFVERDELHVLLLLCHHGFLPILLYLEINIVPTVLSDFHKLFLPNSYNDYA